MSRKITYLLGAGASIEAIPVVDGFNKSFREDFALPFKEQFNLIHTELCSDLMQCVSEIAMHSTVDTYARMLYFSDEQEKLIKLKYFLALFFFWKQHSQQHDKRYDLFFAAILGGYPGRPELPTNIRILSWNYDNQLELSAAKFFKCDSVKQVRMHVPIYPAYENIEMRRSFYDKGFLVHKLNGSADLTIDQMRGQVVGGLNVNSKNPVAIYEDPFLKDYINSYKSTIRKSMIHYSWEEDAEISHYREKALESIQGTEILVVIGYSFPTFNRLTDKTILTNISKSLEKVYVQAPPDAVNESITRVKALSDGSLDDKIYPITSLKEFYIPFEFEGVY